MDKKKMIERVKKLLNLANSDNENEAKLAAANANKLLTKYNLTMQEVEVKRDYDNKNVAKKNRMSQEDKWIFPLLKEFYFIHPVISSSTVGVTYNRWGERRRKCMHTIKFIGEDTNVEIATYIYEFLTKEYRNLWKVYKKKTGAAARSKDSYYHGLTWGIKEQLKKTQKAAQEETGLVLVKDPNLEAYLKHLFPDLKTESRKANIGDQEAQAQGIHDGKKVQLRQGIKSESTGGPNIAAIAAAMVGGA